MPTRVSLFATCLADHFFAEACADTVRLLRHLGFEVDFPEAQTCCGQPSHNTGHEADAEAMMRHTVSVFEDAEYIVVPSGSCASMVRRHYPELSDDPRVSGVAERTYELSQFLVHVAGVTSLGHGLTGTSVAYHHGCHALRDLGVEREPLLLLEGAGATVHGWEADRECCGFGGLFSTKFPEVSGAMADRKLETLPPVDFVTSADGGCLLQMSGRADHQGMPARFRHLASVLWEATRP